MKLVFKFRETGAKHVQYASRRFIQEVEIKKQHVPQLIKLSPRSSAESGAQCMPSIQLSMKSEY